MRALSFLGRPFISADGKKPESVTDIGAEIGGMVGSVDVERKIPGLSTKRKRCKMLIPLVKQVTVVKTSSSPLKLVIHATGSVPTTGWTDPKLVPVPGPAGDTVLDFNFEATPPTGPAGDIVLPISASITVEPPNSVSAVTVISRTNRITVYSSQFSGGITTEIAGEEQQPTAAASAAQQQQQLTTLIAGEESGGITTFVVGEEQHITSYYVGEEHPTTLIFGEEWTTNPQLDDPAGSKSPTSAFGGF